MLETHRAPVDDGDGLAERPLSVLEHRVVHAGGFEGLDDGEGGAGQDGFDEPQLAVGLFDLVDVSDLGLGQGERWGLACGEGLWLDPADVVVEVEAGEEVEAFDVFGGTDDLLQVFVLLRACEEDSRSVSWRASARITGAPSHQRWESRS